jgi:hypothetical protein
VWSGCWADVTIRYCEIKSEHKYIIEYLGNKMDLKALMQTLETIDKKQNLMEAEKKETTWTDKSGKKHPATQVKGDKYTGKEAEKEDKKKADEGISFTSGIAQALLREFGLEEAPVANPYQGADAAKFASMSPADQAWLTKGGGVPDINDPYILMRAPNKGKAVTPATSTPTPGNTDPTKGGVDYSLGGNKKLSALPQTPPATGQAAQPAGKPDLSVNNPAMNPANNAPLPVPGAAATDNQKKLDAMKAKYGTPGSTTRESVQSEDDLILARIRGVSIR